MSDEQLRQLYADATRARTTPRRAECPDTDALVALARREGPEPQRLQTLDHVMACADCRREFELFRAIQQAGRAETKPSTPHVYWKRPLVLTLGTALAAGLALVAVLQPWSTRRPGGETTSVMRGSAADVALAAPVADTLISSGALTFVWRSVPAVRRYTLEVLTPEGAVRALWETTDTTATIPASDLGAGDLRWRVRAQMDGGELRSATRRLRVGGP